MNLFFPFVFYFVHLLIHISLKRQISLICARILKLKSINLTHLNYMLLNISLYDSQWIAKRFARVFIRRKALKTFCLFPQPSRRCFRVLFTSTNFLNVLPTPSFFSFHNLFGGSTEFYWFLKTSRMVYIVLFVSKISKRFYSDKLKSHRDCLQSAQMHQTLYRFLSLMGNITVYLCDHGFNNNIGRFRFTCLTFSQ